MSEVNMAFVDSAVDDEDADQVSEVVETSTENVIKDIKDLGYRYAAHIDGDGEYIKYALANVPGFPDKTKIAAEFVDMFKAGAIVRFTELHPAVHYQIEGEDTYILTDSPIKDKAGFELSVDYAVGMPKHEFGELKPGKKHLVKGLRDAAKNYADLRWSRLLKSAAEQISEAKTRASNKSFMEWLEKVLADMVPKAKRAKDNGDPTAMEVEELKEAIASFKEWLPINKDRKATKVS